MRAAAVALVLIVGAAVVLAFANTLNSWVLGGLIGGLAALLLSIPISLALFTILARRNGEQPYAQQEQTEMDYVGYDEYAEVYETEAYLLPNEEEVYEEPRGRRISEARSLPAPSQSQSYPRLPAAGQSQAHPSGSFSYQRTMNAPQRPRQSTQALPPARGNGRGTPTQQLYPDRRVRQYGYQGNSQFAQHQTAALRAARREAAQEFNDVEVLPTNFTSPLKKVPARTSSEQFARPGTGGPRLTRELSQSQQMANPNRPRRADDANAAQQTGARRKLPTGDERIGNRHTETDSLQIREAETDNLRGRYPYPQTGPMRQQPETGKIARNPQLGDQLQNPDTITGSLQNPMVRRAPYLYEDDPLHEQFARQIDGGPIMRRSSRFENWEADEEK